MDYPTCPVCKHVFADEELSGLVTFWGEEPPVEQDCPNCETPLVIDEQVERTFEVQLAGGDKE